MTDFRNNNWHLNSNSVKETWSCFILIFEGVKEFLNPQKIVLASTSKRLKVIGNIVAK